MATYGPLELCKNKAGYETVPAEKLKLDLHAAEPVLEASGYESLANAGFILVVRRDAIETSVFQSGKLLVKTKDKDAAARQVEGVREALEV